MAENAPRYGLPEPAIEGIQSVFAAFSSIDVVILYGSRALGTYKAGSDIDLTIKTSSAAAENLLSRVMNALDDLDLPYSFDVSLLQHIQNEDLLSHIRRVGIEFYSTQKHSANQRERQRKQRHADEAYQSEARLESKLIQRLTGLGYEPVAVSNAGDLQSNLKRQLEKHNAISLSETEFSKVLNHLDKGNVFERAKILRDRMQLARDDGSSCYLRFLNTDHWCQNEYQVTQQVCMVGDYLNRYDVTLLINGLPLVQIELKRRGIELKEAFNQINRYQRHSFWAESGLFTYVQLFVISNGVDTRYYANNRHQDFKQTFFWSDEQNKPITQLDAFADAFLEKCHISKMICKYVVLHESDKILMVLRPYQYYAVEAIVAQVEQGRKNGYVWHTTGSGKTLTSFKAAQILMANPKVHKVVFVVDRADLDYQTTREFNAFSDGSVDGTNNTKTLVTQLAGEHRLIVTTIQKLNTAISKDRYQLAMETLQNRRVVFIFDECHRSQFGKTHKNIVDFFRRAQLFGFTGTPIFAENVSSNEHGKRTTSDLFGECLHKYLITNAIADQNVLKFSVEYWGKLKRKDGSLIDEQVPAINIRKFFENPERIDSVVDWIIAHHKQKTHNKAFSAMLCVSSVDALTHYYEAFKRKKQSGDHSLRVITIFSYGANEEDADATGEIGDPNFDFSRGTPVNSHSRDKLESCIADYNAMYHTSFSTKDSQSFYDYYKDIAKRMKQRDRKDFQDVDRADILLVVNMYLTGFDAKKLNTLYVDKNLKYHGLIQAFSRTNRTLGDLKSQGNIVCFRNLKKNTDQAIALFSNPLARESVLLAPYEEYVRKFNDEVVTLLEIAPSVDAVNELIAEPDQLAFVRSFRELMRILNILRYFTEFSFADLNLDAQAFEDYKSKYLDIYDRTRTPGGGVSIIDDVDFELELIQRDEINVVYIVELLAELARAAFGAEASDETRARKEAILDLLGRETRLRSKRDLIEKFIHEHMPGLEPEQNLKHVFSEYWEAEKRAAVMRLCESEGMDERAVHHMIDEYHFSNKEPLRETVFDALIARPKLLERKSIFERVSAELRGIIFKFDEDIGDL